MMCEAQDREIYRLKVQVKELEDALAHAVWPDRSHQAILRARFDCSEIEACILAALYKAEPMEWLSASALTSMLPEPKRKGSCPDGLRETNTVRVQVFRLREKRGRGLIESINGEGGGYRLSASGRARIHEVIRLTPQHLSNGVLR